MAWIANKDQQDPDIDLFPALASRDQGRAS